MKKWLTNICLLAALMTSVTVSAQTIKIGALKSGMITNVHVLTGDTVKKGQVLLEIDPARYEALKAVKESNVKFAKLVLEDASIEQAQAMDLFDRTVTSKRVLDAANLEYEIASAKYQAALAELELVKVDKKYFVIRAPMNAVVENVHVVIGSTVFEENDSLIELKVK